MGTTRPTATYHVATLHVKSRAAASFILRHHCGVLHLLQLLIPSGHLRALLKMAAWPFQMEGFLEGSKDGYNKTEAEPLFPNRHLAEDPDPARSLCRVPAGQGLSSQFGDSVMSLQSEKNLPNATQLIARGARIQVLLSQAPFESFNCNTNITSKKSFLIFQAVEITLPPPQNVTFPC